MQAEWKVIDDRPSRILGKLLWHTTQLNAWLVGAQDDYNFINRIYDAQLRLFQANNGKRLP
jgi:hypothetical protein